MKPFKNSDPYLYWNNSVLKNKFNIKKQVKLDYLEEQLLIENLSNIEKISPQLDFFSPTSLQAIHKHLFGDIYEWAGDFRRMNMIKQEPLLYGSSVQYERYTCIEPALKQILAPAKNKTWEIILQSDTPDLTAFIANLWQVHPFREGNTRTTTTYMLLFLEKYRYEIDEQVLPALAKDMRDMLVLYCAESGARPDILESFLGHAIKPLDSVYEHTIQNDISNANGAISDHNINQAKNERQPSQDRTI